MKTIILLLLLALVGWTSVKLGTLYSNKHQLSDRVVYYLDFVDEDSFDSVRQGLIRDAQQWDIELRPDEIQIVYRDIDRPVGPQKFVSKLADFQNKQVAISVRYTARFLGFKRPQEITHSKIRQLAVHQKVRPEYEELLK